mgnify:CR=1 FL=1
MREFELEIPDDLQGSLACLPDATPLAGGTNLLVDIRAHREKSKRLVWLGNIDTFRDIKIQAHQVAIGAGTTISDILRCSEMKVSAPSLVTAARVFGGQMVRNQATVVGNICSGSPAADTMPPLLSLDANIHLTNRKRSRNVPLDQFCTGFKMNLRQQDELITGLSWKVPSPNTENLFYKLGRRKGDAITVVGIAVTITREGDRCTQARIALGAVGPTVFRAKDAEKKITGTLLSEELIEEAAQIAVKQSTPIDDLRASADYRRHSVHVLTRRLITQAWRSLGEKAADT